MINCELKKHEKLFTFLILVTVAQWSAAYFSFYTIFSATETLERPLSTTPSEKLG